MEHIAVLKGCYLLHDDKYRKIIKCKEFLNEQIFGKRLLCALFQMLQSDDQEIRFQLSWSSNSSGKKRHHKEINTVNLVMFYSVRSIMKTKGYCDSECLVDCFVWVNLPQRNKNNRRPEGPGRHKYLETWGKSLRGVGIGIMQIS